MTPLPFAVINDVHTGVIRSTGTTPQTALALRMYVLAKLQELLNMCGGHDLLINGDLFDAFLAPYTDIFAVYEMLAQWMIDNQECTLYLPPGNHDLSKTAATMSSFQFLCQLLKSMFGERVVVPTKGTAIKVAGHPSWVIPHMPNQDQFNIELDKVPKGLKYLFLHCNYDNKFATQSDHSLNLSKEAAAKLDVERIVLGHEHQHRIGVADKVVVTGNQIPTSVADCLGNKSKFMTFITPKSFELKAVWTRDGVNGTSFLRANWRELDSVDASAQFIRVEGDASASEAPAVVTAISKLRKVHSAFVVTNAVSIEGREAAGEIESMEKVANFNVVKALLALLEKNPGWTAKVKNIMEKNNVSAA